MSERKRIRIEPYKDKDILVIDYVGLRHEDLRNHIDRAKDHIVTSGKDDILLLELIHDVKINKNVPGALKSHARAISPHVSRYAVVGLSRATKVLASSLRVFNFITFETFDTEEEAKDYLAG